MVQENTFSRDKEDKGMTPMTVKSFVMSLCTVVVVVSILGDLNISIT